MANLTKPVKLAVLLCDEFSPDAPLSYQQVFHNWLKSSRPDLECTLDGFDVVKAQEYPSLDEGFSAVIISGSTSSAFSDDPWITKLLLWIVRTVERYREVKLIGICFGHQIIARALGGTCIRNTTWETGSTRIALTNVGQKLFRTNTDPPFVYVQEMHTDHVIDLPEICLPLGSSALTPCQGFVVPYSNTRKIHSQTQLISRTRYPSLSRADSPPISQLESDIQILTMQGHPEFTPSIVLYIIEMLEAGNVLSKSLAEEARRNAVCRVDDGCGIIGEAVWRVVLGEPPVDELNSQEKVEESNLVESTFSTDVTDFSDEEYTVSDSAEETDREGRRVPFRSSKGSISSWVIPYGILLPSILILPFSLFGIWRWAELSR